MESGEKPGTGPWFPGARSSGFPPVRFRIGPLPACLLVEQSCSVPDLALGSPWGGVRSGIRSRRAASAPGQAGGETETETQSAAPAHAGAALYGH
jgi:hypothetical protein